MYRNIQTFAFKLVQECSSWASGNSLVQMFFPTPNRNMFAGKFVKLERLLAVLWEHVTFNVKCVEVHKISEAFWAKLYCKTSDFFTSFCWLWDFLQENLQLKKTLMMSTGKKLYARNNFFQKRIPNLRFWIIYILVQISFFGGLL